MAAAMDDSELFSYAKQLQVPVDLLRETAKLGRLPVVNFAAGGLGKIDIHLKRLKKLFMKEHEMKKII